MPERLSSRFFERLFRNTLANKFTQFIFIMLAELLKLFFSSFNVNLCEVFLYFLEAIFILGQFFFHHSTDFLYPIHASLNFLWYHLLKGVDILFVLIFYLFYHLLIFSIGKCGTCLMILVIFLYDIHESRILCFQFFYFTLQCRSFFVVLKTRLWLLGSRWADIML